ncbi:DUF302 domain-containing protein [Sulfurimonas lithotrophica]|uniref:DUF302 domain-containing protein n=1 Tax=Sulfurimonas lithotrophica TaxID=2590022 RepID=A0A5P8P2C8_9BACT|nr:DUF302 domain-containing protein [Sulfurimonas lithotrophica]QFR49893.1 DUF302 domain-containing protein [Sulfurimonas lithotrophica]
MKKIVLITLFVSSMFANDIIIKQSSYSVDKTMQNIKDILNAKGLNIFAVIDHQKNAKNIDMNMNESKVIIFGNPKVGTKFMNENMASGLDLPLKIIIYKDKDSKVKLAYRDGTWLKKEHGLSSNKLINKVSNALNNITNKAIK